MTKSYVINKRPYTLSSSLENELQLDSRKNYCFELDYLTALTVTGERAADFLQGQLSCDLRRVTHDSMQRGLMCNLQGRIVALLDVINWHGFQLILPADLATTTQTSLSKIALLSKVALQAKHAYRIYGFYLNNLDDLIPTNLSLPTRPLAITSTHELCCYCLSTGFYIFLVPDLSAATFCQPFINKQQMRGSLLWHHLQLQKKQLTIYPDTKGLFLPHRLDMHLNGYLSFDKGCYKGQEIIARMHYKAKLKHGLKLFTIETKEPLIAGKKLSTSDGLIELGELVDFSSLTPHSYCIATSILFEHPQQILIENQENPVVLCEIEPS